MPGSLAFSRLFLVLGRFVVSPKHSVATCPICGGGLCGIRVCGLDPNGGDRRLGRLGYDGVHGLVVCDECDAIWLEPDVSTVHHYPSVVDARCPICDEPLWGPQSRWAEDRDVAKLGWEQAVDRSLDIVEDEGAA